jgi:hypothetical protein
VAGYSGTPLPKKLGITEGAHVSLVGAPAGFERELEPLPPGARVSRRVGKAVDVIVFFTTRRRELERRFRKLAGALAPAGGFWIAWPKRSSGVDTDLTEDVTREVGLPTGLVDNKVCAIDETWSGIRFVIRKENRPPAGTGLKRAK